MRGTSKSTALEKMKSFMSEFQDAHVKFVRQKAGSFNTFHVLGIDSDEVKHSQFLAWLFDSKSNHGLENQFLRAFVDLGQIDIRHEELKMYSVLTEVMVKESRIDMAIFRVGKYLIYIENKIRSEESPDQLKREFRDMYRFGSELRVPKDKMFPVFLTPKGRTPVSGDPENWKLIWLRNYV